MSNDISTAVRILNEAFTADPAAIHSLLVNRVPCNQKLVDHPSVICDTLAAANEEWYTVGFLGVLNGVLEPMTGKRVAMKWSEPDWSGRRHILGFQEYQLATL